MDPPPDGRLSAPSRGHDRRARCRPWSAWASRPSGPLLTRVAVDDAVAGSTATLVPVVAALVGLAVVRFGAAFLRRLPRRAARRSTSSTTCAGTSSPPSQRLDGAGRTRCAPGRWSSRAITDLQLVQGLLAMVPLVARQRRARRRVARGHAVAVAAAHRWSRSSCCRRGDRDDPARRRSLFPATWSAQQQRGRRRPARRGDRHRRPGGQGLRAGGPRGRHAGGAGARRLYAERMRAARMTARLNPALLALPTLGQVGVIGLGGCARAERRDHARHLPGVHHLRRRSSSGPPGCSARWS